jgi:hypothetical protein
MFNVCTACGISHVEPEFDGSGHLVCAACGDRRPFKRLPLLLVGGAAGAGKSTAGAALLGELTEAVVIECDLLWRKEFDTPGDGYRVYSRMWLRLAAHISQSGRPCALFGASFAVPRNTQPLPERQLFSGIHYLGLVCDDDVLASRLRARPTWRDASDELIGEHIKFNRWLRGHASEAVPPVTLIDTTRAAVRETAALVAGWIRGRATQATQDAPAQPDPNLTHSPSPAAAVKPLKPSGPA